MKVNLLYTVFLGILVAFLFYGSSSGAGAVQGADRTGSPLSTGACDICHGANNFAPSVSLELLDGETSVTEYEPGASYTVRLTIATDQGEPAGYGFQLVALTGSSDANAGAWQALPDGVQVTTIDERDYAEHERQLNDNVLELEWTAPLDDPGEVRFYAAGNAVNGNGSTSGDGSASLGEPFVVAPRTSAFRPLRALDVSIDAWPNPLIGEVQVRIKGAVAGNYQLSVADMQGQLLVSRLLGLQGGEHYETIDFGRLPAGQYLLRLSDGRRIATTQVLKAR